MEIHGLKGVEEALSQAGPKLAKAALRKALRAGGKHFVNAAKSRAPVKTGGLRDAIAMTVKMSPKQQSGSVKIGPKRDKEKGNESPGVYGMYSEFGTKNMPARPWLRPAFDATAASAQDAFTSEIRAGIETLK